MACDFRGRRTNLPNSKKRKGQLEHLGESRGLRVVRDALNGDTGQHSRVPTTGGGRYRMARTYSRGEMPQHVEEVVLRVAPAAKPVPGRVPADDPGHTAAHDAEDRKGAAKSHHRRVPPDA